MFAWPSASSRTDPTPGFATSRLTPLSNSTRFEVNGTTVIAAWPNSISETDAFGLWPRSCLANALTAMRMSRMYSSGVPYASVTRAPCEVSTSTATEIGWAAGFDRDHLPVRAVLADQDVVGHHVLDRLPVLVEHRDVQRLVDAALGLHRRGGHEQRDEQDGQQHATGSNTSGHQEPPARIIPLASSSAGLSASAASACARASAARPILYSE